MDQSGQVIDSIVNIPISRRIRTSSTVTNYCRKVRQDLPYDRHTSTHIDGNTLAAKTTRTTYTVDIVLTIPGSTSKYNAIGREKKATHAGRS